MGLLPLTLSEARIFEALVGNPGRVATKQMLFDCLYKGLDEASLKILDVFICKARRKIAAATGGDPVIETVWGRGYMAPMAPMEAAA